MVFGSSIVKVLDLKIEGAGFDQNNSLAALATITRILSLKYKNNVKNVAMHCKLMGKREQWYHNR